MFLSFLHTLCVQAIAKKSPKLDAASTDGRAHLMTALKVPICIWTCAAARLPKRKLSVCDAHPTQSVTARNRAWWGYNQIARQPPKKPNKKTHATGSLFLHMPIIRPIVWQCSSFALFWAHFGLIDCDARYLHTHTHTCSLIICINMSIYACTFNMWCACKRCNPHKSSRAEWWMKFQHSVCALKNSSCRQ